jgi:hypothetical protein
LNFGEVIPSGTTQGWVCPLVQNNYWHPYQDLSPLRKALLNGLKQVTFNGWNACDVCEIKVSMFKPNSVACLNAYVVTCHMPIYN